MWKKSPKCLIESYIQGHLKTWSPIDKVQGHKNQVCLNSPKREICFFPTFPVSNVKLWVNLQMKNVPKEVHPRIPRTVMSPFVFSEQARKFKFQAQSQYMEEGVSSLPTLRERKTQSKCHRIFFQNLCMVRLCAENTICPDTPLSHFVVCLLRQLAPKSLIRMLCDGR